MIVVYDYDELGRPIVNDLYRDEGGRLVNLRTYPLNPRVHDWGLGSERFWGRSEASLVTVLRLIYRWGRYYGLPSYVIDTAALIAKKRFSRVKYVRHDKYDVVAVAFLKIAARMFGIRFKAREHRKGLLKMMRRLDGNGDNRGY